MRTHHDAKLMAKTLGDELKAHNITLPHGQCLDIVAKQFGLKDWNVLSAKMDKKAADQLSVPDGWKVGGNAPHLFDLGLGSKGSSTLIIRRKTTVEETKREEYATLMQVVSAKQYIGKRMSFKAELKAENVVGSATIWFRIDDAQGNVLEFSNMERRPTDGSIAGDTDWLSRKIVFSIPENAMTLHFGFYLLGFGEAYARNFTFEIFENDEVDETGSLPSAPQNLSLALA